MQQHVHPASRQNSALRVDFLFYTLMAKMLYNDAPLTTGAIIKLLKKQRSYIQG